MNTKTLSREVRTITVTSRAIRNDRNVSYYTNPDGSLRAGYDRKKVIGDYLSKRTTISYIRLFIAAALTVDIDGIALYEREF